MTLAALVRNEQNEHRVHVVQGSNHVTGDPTVVLSTILGSCVAACVRDPALRVGGMNHFLLPSAPNGEAGDNRYGVQAMELLINGLLGLGADRRRLEAKLFGGARMIVGLSDIGAKNAEFARDFLKLEGIRLVGESLGGDRARRLHFWPSTGRASQQLVQDPKVIAAERTLTRQEPKPAASSAGELELF